MRILHVTQSMNPDKGGVTECIRLFSAESVRQGHEVEIATMDSPDSGWVRDARFPMHCFPQSRKGFHAPGLVDWLAENGPKFDGVIAHGLWRYQGHATRVAAAVGGFDYFVFPHGMLDPWFRQNSFLKHVGKQLYWLWREYRVLRDAKAVLFTCREEMRLAPTFFPYKVNGLISPLGLEEPPAAPEALTRLFFTRFPEFAGKTNILFLGRVHEKKGVDLLIKAFAQCRAGDDVNVLIAGPVEESLQRAYTALAERSGVADRVFWLGMLYGDDKWAALSAADAFVLPSHQENFGIAVVEALACGTPVLISDKVNIWREIAESRAGLANPDTMGGTRKSLEDFLALDFRQRDLLSDNAMACFENKFNAEQATNRLLEIIGSNSDGVRS